MDLQFNNKLSQSYKSKSQIARVLSEDWVQRNAYCPNCGELPLESYANNRPVADFFCNACSEDFELKSKKGYISKSIVNGAYNKMIERVNSDKNPNFFFITYSQDLTVSNFLIIPKQFFTDKVIVKRPPLSSTAKRAGWVGCNIDLSRVAQSGKVFYVKNSTIINREKVKEKFRMTTFLRNEKLEERKWILDILQCVEQINDDYFELKDIYKFESKLKSLYPENNFIKAKIRQQLQVLRDKGIIETLGPGKFRKLNHEDS